MGTETVVRENSSQEIDDLSELPQGWIWTTVKDLGSLIRGVSYDKSEASKQPNEGFFPILRATNINKELDFDNLVYVPSKYVSSDQIVKRFDIIVAMSSGSKDLVGKAAQSNTDFNGSFGTFCGLIRPVKGIDERYFGLFFKGPDYRKKISSLSKGIGINNLRRGDLESINIPLPPLLEQYRIVEKVEELFTQLDAGVAALEKVQAQLKRYRQATLKAAFDGRLTQEWREQQKKDETQSISIHQNLHLIPEENAIDDNLLMLPDGWVWGSFKTITNNFDGKRIPVKREDRKEIQGIYPYYGASGIIDYVNDYLFDGEYLLIGEDGANLLARSTPIAFRAKGQFWVNNHAHIVQSKHGIPLEYLEQYINSINLIRYVTGTAQPKMTQRAMNTIPVPIAPLDEQYRIVSEIERLFSITDEIEKYIYGSLNQAESLRRSILKKAFEGKLVPQDPNDEPASVLLERIRAEKAKQEPSKKRAMKTKTTTQRRLIPNGE